MKRPRDSRLRIFITGGAGFIGMALARNLATGALVTCYDNLLPQVHGPAPVAPAVLAMCGARLVQGDIRDGPLLADALEAARPDVILHLAADTATGQSHSAPTDCCAVNVAGTATLVEAVRRAAPSVRRVILASSRAVYGEGAYCDASGAPAQPGPRSAVALARGMFNVTDVQGRLLSPLPANHLTAPAPISIYGSSKLMQEYLLAQGFWGSSVGVGILRLQNIYGPNALPDNPHSGVLTAFARAAATGQHIPLFEDGLIMRDFLWLDDAVAAFHAMVNLSRLPDHPIDIGSGTATSLASVARHLCALSATSAGVKITGRTRPGDIRHACADIGAARTLLGWEPRVPIADGLARLIEGQRLGQAA